MEGIIKQFGFDPMLLGAQVVNFLIILFLLKRFAYKPMLTLLQKRQDSVRKTLEESDQAHKLLEEVTEREKKILQTAQGEATKIIEDARKESEKMLVDTESAAKKQQEKMMKETKQQISQEMNMAKKELSSSISRLAIDFLEKATADLFTEKDQKEVMARALTRIKKKAD